MLFSSMTFIFMFLPVVCAVYFLLKEKYRNEWLLFTSIVFYGWGEPRYLPIMLTSILLNWAGALCVERMRRKKTAVAVTLILNLAFLFYFKYTDFVIENINEAFGTHFNLLKIVLPVGISFYTFQAMSYVIDVYRGEVRAQSNLLKLGLYIALFPPLIAGPIVKYHDIADQIDGRTETADKAVRGFQRFIIGLAKKMLIANTMGAVADKVFSLPVSDFDVLTAWIGAIAYTFQIFFDFSGYSDMAIGLSLVFGFHIPENFNYPYISKSITEFWRRWHISLSTWFKQYLYIPLGGNRVSKPRNYFNLLVVFLATGFWHGASWSFIFWGLWHGFFIVFEKLTGWHKDKQSSFVRCVQHIYALFVVIVGWVMFRADTMAYAWEYLKKMFGFGTSSTMLYGLRYYANTQEYAIAVAAVLLSMPLFAKVLDFSAGKVWLRSAVNLGLVFLFLLSWGAIAASTYNPFIYFRF